MIKEILIIINWYLISLIPAIAVFPLSNILFKKFEDKGYAISRMLGILLISYISWILASFKVLAFTTLNLWIITILLTLFLIFISQKKHFKHNYKAIIIDEMVYIIAFGIMITYRSLNPDIKDIEKFMDFSILNGILRGNFLPPTDTWFSGTHINYYYFGQYTIAVLAKMSKVPSYYVYNLAISNIYANTALISFFIAKKFVKNVYMALITPTLIIFCGNLDFFIKLFLQGKNHYFYAEARSLIPQTINEFPSYSFIIGDLHAHIVNIPSVLLFIAVTLSIFLYKQNRNIKLVLASLLLGIFFITNSWDYILYLPFIMVILSIKYTKSKKYEYLILEIVSIIILSLFFVIPYLTQFKPPVRGLGIVKANMGDIKAIIVMFGFFLLVVLPFLIKNLNFKILGQKKILFIVILIIFGLGYILLPEIFYLKDIYSKANPPYYRANTVFKVWYQSWILLSLATGISFKYNLKYLKKSKLILYSYILVVGFLYIWVISYFFYAVFYVVGKKPAYKGLNGQQYIIKQNKDELETINWINKNIKGQPIILQADGNAYTNDTLITSFTGLPTVVGWRDHEFGWRGDWEIIANRMGDIQKIYQGTSKNEVEMLIKKYNISYVILSKKEKEKYGTEAGITVKDIGKTIYKANSVELIKL